MKSIKARGHNLGRDNALGFLRLVFAVLVIVSHTPEMLDGDRRRELLTGIFGTISFGELAVDAFFVISGYLIVASYVTSNSWRSYLWKRCVRIYPGFVIASLISLFLVAPLAGANWSDILGRLPLYLGKIAALQYLEVPGTFVGLAYHGVNGAVWTIAYEFRCYLAVMLLGLIGAFRKPAAIAALAIVMMVIFAIVPADKLRAVGLVLPLARVWMGWLDTTLRLTGFFLVGSLFFLCRDRVTFTGRGAVVAMVCLIACLCIAPIAEAGVAIFGGYLIFGFAIWGRGMPFQSINNKDDISYGTYLYGWPIGGLVLTTAPTLPLWVSTVAIIVLSMVAGWASWRWIEQPAMHRLTRKAEHLTNAAAALTAQ